MNSTNKAAPAPQKIYSDTYRVGLGYSVRFTFTPVEKGIARIDGDWSPTLPGARDQRRLLERYRQVRDRFVASVAARTGHDGAFVVEAEQ